MIFKSNQLADNPSGRESDRGWNGFSQKVSAELRAEQRPLSPGKKNHTNAELNVWGVSQRTLKISPIHEIAQLKMCLCCSIAAPAVSSACWFYVVDVGRLFFFFFLCLFVCLLLLEEKLLWLTFRGALFMKHNHYIPYPSPPATSAPDSLWTSICVWGNTMDKRSIQHRLKSSHLAAPFSKTLHRLTQSGEQRVCLRGKCRCVPRTRNRNQVISVSKLGYFLDIYTGKKTPALICD